MSRFTLRFRFPPVRRGSHVGSGSWLRSGLGERLSASWRKSTVLDPGIVPPHLLRFTSCPWVCEPTGHVDISHNNKKKLLTVIHGKFFSTLWWASPNVKVHSSLTVHNSQRCSRLSQRSYELIIVCAANGWWVTTANMIFQNPEAGGCLTVFLDWLSQFFDRKWTVLINEESIKCN